MVSRRQDQQNWGGRPRPCSFLSPGAWGSAPIARRPVLTSASFAPFFLLRGRPSTDGGGGEGGRAPERGGGWRRLGSVSPPKPSPRKPGLSAEPEKGKTGWEAGNRRTRGPRGRGGRAAWTPGSCKGRRLRACPLGSQREEGGWGPGRLSPAPLPSLRDTHIHSLLQQIHIYQVLSVPGTVLGEGGGQGREMNEAVTEASGKVRALWIEPDCSIHSTAWASDFPSLSLSFPLCDEAGIYSLDPKRPVFIQHLLWASSVLGAGATVANTEPIGLCRQGAHGPLEEAGRHRCCQPPGEGVLMQETGCSASTGIREGTELSSHWE